MTATNETRLDAIRRLFSKISGLVSPKLTKAQIEREIVQSNSIVTVGYNAHQRCLHVEYFNGNLYRVSDVSPADHQTLKGADDFDHAFRQLIAADHKMTKIGAVMPIYR